MKRDQSPAYFFGNAESQVTEGSTFVFSASQSELLKIHTTGSLCMPIKIMLTGEIRFESGYAKGESVNTCKVQQAVSKNTISHTRI
jgi:hypothetical protein